MRCPSISHLLRSSEVDYANFLAISFDVSIFGWGMALGRAHIFDGNFEAKPAYHALADTLAGTPTVVDECWLIFDWQATRYMVGNEMGEICGRGRR